MNFDDDNIVEICMHCKGKKPCWCNLKDEEKEYVKTWEWVYNAIHNLNPV